MPRLAALAPMRHRTYRLLTASLAGSLFSAGVLVVALVWQVVALGGGPGELAQVTTANASGMLLTALLGGVLADRLPQRHILLVVECTKALALGGCAVLSLTGALHVTHVAVAALVAGLADGLYYPAYSAYLPKLVPAEDLLAANGIEGALRPTLMNAAGPAVSGAVVAAVSPGAAFAVAAAATIVAAACLVPLPAIPAERQAGGDRVHLVAAVTGDVAEGLRYLRRTPWLWATLGWAAFAVLAFMGPFEVLIPFLIKDHAGGGPGDHALVLAAFGIGGAIGSLAVASRPLPRRYLTAMLLTWGLGILPLAVLGFATRVSIIVVVGLVVGFAFQAGSVIWGTLLQRRVPEALLGRVSSLDFFVSLLFMPISMALAVPVSQVIGLRETFVVAGVLPALLAVAALVVARLPADEVANPLDRSPVAGSAERSAGDGAAAPGPRPSTDPSGVADVGR